MNASGPVDPTPTDPAAPAALARARALLERPLVARVLEALDGDGEEARIVGGAVRDALLGLPVADVDVATTATPDVVIARARAAGLRPIPTGVEHGTVTLLPEAGGVGSPIEVTTLREDVETDGRRARVRFGRDFAADAARRDFTINALALSHDGALHDLTNGVADLAAGRVRFIGEAGRRVAEDRLRVLRFFRFHARFGLGAPNGEALSAAIAARDELAPLSRERVRAELLRLVAGEGGRPGAAGAEAALRLLSACGLAERLTGGLFHPAHLAGLPPDDALLRLAAVGVSVREDAARLAERLRLSNAEAARLDAAARAAEALHGLAAAGRLPPKGAPGWRALVHRLGREPLRDAARVLEARGALPRGSAASVEDARVPARPFSARDLIARGVPAGPALGLALRAADAAWAEADCPENEDDLRAILDAAVGSVAGPSQVGGGTAPDPEPAAPATRTPAPLAPALRLSSAAGTPPAETPTETPAETPVETSAVSDAPPPDRPARGERLPAEGGFVREAFDLPRAEARLAARSWLRHFPKAAYMTGVESWREADGRIRFVMRRLRSAD